MYGVLEIAVWRRGYPVKREYVWRGDEALDSYSVLKYIMHSARPTPRHARARIPPFPPPPSSSVLMDVYSYIRVRLSILGSES